MKKRTKLLCMLCAVAILCSCVACGPKDSTSSIAEVTSGEVTSTESVDGSTDNTSSEVTSGDTDATSEEAASTAATPSVTTSSKKQTTTGNNTSKDSYGQREETNVKDQPKVIDMKGATLTLGVKNEEQFGNGKAGESESGDRWIAWRKNFEKTYNCKLKNVVVSSFTMYDSLATKLMSGEKVADILTVQLFDVEAFRHAGLLQPLQSSETLDLEHKSVVQDMVNKFTFNGNSYMYATGFYNEVAGLYFNKDLIKELKLEDPYTLVKNKKWTWEAFAKMCEAAYKDDGDNKIDNGDRFGAYVHDDFLQAALAVSGIRVISYNNGKFEYTFNTANTLTWMNQAKTTLHNSKAILPMTSIQSTRAEAKFVKGELLFIEGATNILGNDEHQFWDIEFDYGYLPVPTFKAGMGYSNSGSTWLGGYAIPKNTNQNSYIGYFLNSYADMELSEAAETKKEFIKFFGGDTEAYNLLASYNHVFNKDLYCWQTQFKDLYGLQFTNHMFDSSVTAKQLIEKIDSGMKNAVKDYYAKDPDLME